MACQKKKAQKKAKAVQKEAAKKAKKAQKVAGSRFQEQAEKAQDIAQDLGSRLQDQAEKANHWVQKEVTPRLQEGLDKASPAVESAVAKGRVQAGAAAAALAQKLDSVDADNDRVEALAQKLTGDKKAVKKYQKQAVKSAKSFAKEQKKAQRKSHKGWLVFGLLAAGTAAAVAAWRASRPVEDPWKTPADAAQPAKDQTSRPAAPQKPAEETAADSAAGSAGKSTLKDQQVSKPASAKAPSNQEISQHVDAKDTSHAAPGAPMNKAATPDPKKADTTQPAEVKSSEKSESAQRHNVEGKDS